jgi:hypothetical protein
MAGTNIMLSPPLQSALAAIRAATEGMTGEQLKWHPEGKWSSAEILEHLVLAYGRTADRMEPLLQQDLPEARRRTFKERIGGVIVLQFGRIPSGRKAPEALCPKGMKPVEARICIEEKLSHLDHLIDQCEQRFGRQKNILDHAILGPLSASQWRKFHCVHTLHHMKQIKALRQSFDKL